MDVSVMNMIISSLFSKGGRSVLENCQILQQRVNRFKGNEDDDPKSFFPTVVNVNLIKLNWISLRWPFMVMFAMIRVKLSVDVRVYGI